MTDLNSFEEPVKSPCVGVCKLDSEGCCIGCYRSKSEITYWTTYSDNEKLKVIELCKQRENQ